MMKPKVMLVAIMKPEVIFAIILVIIIVIYAYALHAEKEEWDLFASSHACKQVAYIAGSTFNTFGIGGDGHPAVGVVSTPGKTGWLCDDGITYYR